MFNEVVSDAGKWPDMSEQGGMRGVCIGLPDGARDRKGTNIAVVAAGTVPETLRSNA